MRHKAKYIVLEAVLVLFTLSILLWISIPRFLDSQNVNTPENFPDPMVRAAVETFMGVEPGEPFYKNQTYDKKNSLFIPKESLYSQKLIGVSDLTGLQYFPNISSLLIRADKKLAAIDLSFHPLLNTIDIQNCHLHDLSFANSPNIERITIQYGSVEVIDISKNLLLQSLACNNNQISELDISNNHNLSVLICCDNLLERIELANNNQLKVLVCFGNRIETLNVRNCPNIEKIYVSHNPLQNLDLRNQPRLIELVLDLEQLFNLNIMLHPSVSPVISIIEKNGRDMEIQDLPLEQQESIQVQIDHILGKNRSGNINNATAP